MKKIISVFLVMALLTAMLAVSVGALSVSDVDEDGKPLVISAAEGVAAYEAEMGTDVETQRIYFQMPDGKRGTTASSDVSVHHPDELDPETGEVIKEAYDEVVIHTGDKAPTWYNDYNVLNGKHYAGIYWWGGAANVDGKWVGYRAEIEDYDQGIYYVDLPKDVTTIIWNNGVDGGTDSSKAIYYLAAQTNDTNSEGAYEGDFDTLPYGSPDPYYFDRCIYVVDPNQVDVNPYSGKLTCGANWYVYYGNGCYGEEFKDGVDYEKTPNWSENMQDVCKNPDHFNAQGVHVGYTPSTHVHTPGAAVKENQVYSTCTTKGSYDNVVYCTECGEELSRTHKTRSLNPNAHIIAHKDAKAATATTDGWHAYYYCTECGKYFADEAHTTEITWDDIVIPASGGSSAGILGDIDNDKSVTIIDATVMQRVDAKIMTCTSAMLTRGDVDKDNAVTVLDATRVQRYLLALDDGLGIGEAIG